MRQLSTTLAALVLLPLAQAAENWFLPYEPDGQTIALFHLDSESDEQRSAAEGEITIKFHKGASRVAGKFGQAADLRGNGQILRLSKHDALLLRNDQEFTIELWAKPELGNKTGLISLATRFYLHVAAGPGTGSFGYRAASFPIRFFPLNGIRLRRRQWNHVALTHDKDRVARIYVNGMLCASAQHKDEGDFPKAGGGTFGAHDGWKDFFVGQLDEIRISRKVREFQPLLTRPSYVAGESVQLNLDPQSLPKHVAGARVRILAGRKVVIEKQLTRDTLAGAIAPASALPPSRGAIEVTFLDGSGQAVSTLSQPAAFVGQQMDSQRQRLMALESSAKDASTRRGKGLALYVERTKELLDARDMAEAEQHLRAAERIALAMAEGETAYRRQVRRVVRMTESKRDVRISMSWPAESPEQAAAAFPWAERIGANELVAGASRAKADALRVWKDKGYHTAALSGVPIHDHHWVHDHPEDRQTGYWRTDPVTAKSATVAIKIVSPSWGGGTRIDNHYKAKAHWFVRDMADRSAKLAWTYDGKTQQVTITNATPGRQYGVYFRFTNTGVGDPLRPSFQRRGLDELTKLVKPLAGALDTYWYDDLGFAYPGPTPQKAWDWESYTLAAHPDTIKQFEADTGIEFDPEWLVMPPKTIEMVPDRRYLAWMEWTRPRVAAWMAKATGVLRNHGMEAWLYWGDCHVGVEPYLGSLDAGRVNQIDKPSSDPVTGRALIDFSGTDVYRRLRVMWLHDHFVPRAKSPGLTETTWRRAKRGLLMGFPSAIYWMPFPSVTKVTNPAVREDMTETISEISDEFQLLGRHLGGHRAFTHDINVYVINSWGKVYSWRPWGAARLWPLTDMPVNVRFVSLDEIAKNGVPDDAHVLFNYGQPNSSWSGGHFWESPELRANIERFVRNGGGFIGMQSPSHCEKPKPHWALAGLLGVTAEGTAEFQPDKFDQSMLADTALEAPKEDRPTARLSKAQAGGKHWIGQMLPAHVVNVSGLTRVAATAQDAAVLFAAADAAGKLSPGAVVREAGRGRCVYLAAYSKGYDFCRLMRRCVFWAAKSEDRFGDLDATGAADVFAYAYPSANMLALMRDVETACTAQLRCRPRIFGLGPATRVNLVDAATGKAVFSGAGAQLASGVDVPLPADCVRLLHLEHD